MSGRNVSWVTKRSIIGLHSSMFFRVPGEEGESEKEGENRGGKGMAENEEKRAHEDVKRSDTGRERKQWEK